jgi:hypothetical protein
MRNTILRILTITIGLSICACKNSNNRETIRSGKSDTGAIEYLNPDLPQDTLKEYVPDDREMEYIYEGVFDIPEIFVNQSPDEPKAVKLKPSENVISYDINPSGMVVASLIKNDNKSVIKLWRIDQNDFFETINVPDGISPCTIVWHPSGDAFFVVANSGDGYSIIRYDKEGTNWKPEEIYASGYQINRVIFCPRPFLTYSDYKNDKSFYAFRLFFGLQKEDGSYRVVSVTEFGKKFYQVIGPSRTFTRSKSYEIDPSHLEADWALPVAFHPSGQSLIWENSGGKYSTAQYMTSAWGERSEKLKPDINGDQINITPNGLGLFIWQKETRGIKLFLAGNDNPDQLVKDKMLLSLPVSTPDGKGLIGLVKDNDLLSLEYILIKYPLSEVVNAWMFAESKPDIDLLALNHGLFRPLNDDQLYQLYESENYYCNSYDQSTPTRPYLITTDIFWELYGSAFQGIFTVKEKAQAIPAFWSFVRSANSYFSESSPNSPWTGVFQTLVKLEENDLSNPEVKRINNSSGKTYSGLLKKEYDYSQLKPMGIYSSNGQMELYYRAFKYLTTVFETDKQIVSLLNNLPPETKELALTWINSYMEFVSKPRRQDVFLKGKFAAPRYVQYPDSGLSVFPLSWGFDNEVLNSVVFHSNYPIERQIVSKKGELRLQPSGLDLAAAISSDFADRLLEDEYNEYPNLRPVIQSLRNNFNSNSSSRENTLYDQWINALAVQWTDTVRSTSRDQEDPLWQVKRLQTGLASWATLRHATVLVNETGAAECGEGGFEEILMRAPRGYVEPDPYTLDAIANLFEKTSEYLPIQDGSDPQSRKVYEGIARHLKETAEEIKLFKKIAEKEINGESLTNEDYHAILYVARIAEHKFLIFKSLANLEYSLANPDPMPKITNVFGNAMTSYLLVAVGRPLEWDYIVPFYGRKQVVKGSVYSYYEFVNDNLINDSEWLTQLPSQDLPEWIEPFVSYQNLSFPPVCGF